MSCACPPRRDFLQTVAAAAGVAIAAGSSAAAAAKPEEHAGHALASPAGKAAAIDTHAHLWPTEYLDELERLGDKSTAIARNMRATDSEADLAHRLANMDAAGVRTQLLSPTPQVPQMGDPADAAKVARMINDVYAGLIRKYPGRFLAYGAVPLPHVDEAIREARRSITELGFKGVAINTLTATRISVADPAFLPFYEEMNRLGAIVYIHPTGCAANSSMMKDFRLEWVVGAPIEDSLAALHLLKADIPHKFPNIRFHVAHLGGALAFMMQRIEDNFTDWKAFPRSPWAELRKFWFDTANFHVPALLCMDQTFSSDRLLLGSDFPYFQDEKYTRAVSYVQKSGLSPDKVRAILSGNAAKLLGLGAKHG